MSDFAKAVLMFFLTGWMVASVLNSLSAGRYGFALLWAVFVVSDGWWGYLLIRRCEREATS